MDKDQNINAIQECLHSARYLKIREFLYSRLKNRLLPCIVYTCLIDDYEKLSKWILDNNPLENFEGLDISHYETLIATKATDLEAIGLHVIEQKVA